LPCKIVSAEAECFTGLVLLFNAATMHDSIYPFLQPAAECR
jgi:hypothetical protein